MEKNITGISKFAKFLLCDEEFIKKRIAEQIEYIDDLDTNHIHITNPLLDDKLEKKDSAMSRLVYFRERLAIIYAQTEGAE